MEYLNLQIRKMFYVVNLISVSKGFDTAKALLIIGCYACVEGRQLVQILKLLY